jgi:peptidoglycan hydrolase-like protein with peptidoglycan-binding domain
MTKSKTQLAIAMLCAAICSAMADPVTEKVQQTLKDQGFYYGEVTGTMDADTTAAIRRYQIRNGLKITGELDVETQKSIGVSGGSVAKATPKPETPPPTPETSDLRDDSSASTAPAPVPVPTEPPRVAPYPGYAPGPRGLQPQMSGLFDGTPYEVAPPDVQQRVITGAQSLLAGRGYYRSGIDGVYGPGMQFALRAFQQRIGLAATGRLDMETLAALGLLPGQHAPRFGPPRRHFMRRPPAFAPNGEPIYVPN